MNYHWDAKIFNLSVTPVSVWVGKNRTNDRNILCYICCFWNGNNRQNYTRARRPVVLRASWACADRAGAGRAEYRIKKLSRTKKIALMAGRFPVEWLGPRQD